MPVAAGWSRDCGFRPGVYCRPALGELNDKGLPRHLAARALDNRPDLAERLHAGAGWLVLRGTYRRPSYTETPPWEAGP